MDYIKLVKDEIMMINSKYIETSLDKYDFYKEHIRYVVKEAKELANKYSADLEIVEIGALLHDIALMANVGDRKEHHINGSKLARELLEKINYEESKIERVVKCVLNHRSSKNATSIEELCVSDGDILAHFDNIPMLFNSAFNRCNVTLNDIKPWLKETFNKDYDDLSDKSKEIFKDKYKMICDIVIGDIYEENK